MMTASDVIMMTWATRQPAVPRFFTHGLGIGGQWVWVLFYARLAVAAVGVVALFVFDSAATAIIVTALAWAILVVIEIAVQCQRQE